MSTTLIAACAAYAVMGLLSAGYALRASGRHRWIEAFAAAALWPIYWLGYVGPTEMLRRLVAAFFTEDGAVLVFALIAVYTFVVLMFPAYYIAKSWEACSGSGCAAVIAKAVIWAPFWPAYLLAAITP
jgi:hypothetical protein